MRKRSATKYSGNRIAPGTRRFVDLLRDGPRPFEETVIEAAKAVAPGIAKRRFEKANEQERHRNAFYVAPPVELQIASGSRWIVLASIRGLAISGKIRFFDNGVVDMVALTPEGRTALLGEVEPEPLVVDPTWHEIVAYRTTDKRYRMASGGNDADDDGGND